MDIEYIEKKEAELNAVSKKLKYDFIGLDNQIDKIMNHLRIWYIMPELLSRPTIINLWGMTGTGKTDLVRKLSKYLKMSDKLLEIQMDSSDSDDGWGSINKVKDAIYSSDIEEGECGIILFDEFQRFRTVESDGTTITPDKFNDIWMLLSDGIFNADANGRKRDLLETIYLEEMSIKDGDRNKPKSSKKSKKKVKITRDVDIFSDDEDDDTPYGDQKVSFWRAKGAKKVLKLPDELVEICQMTNRDLLQVYKNNIDNQDIYTGGDFSKCLIFICGNLDDLYSMSRSVADADSNADILHKFSKQINIVNVKNCLSTMFKPEQVARMGNSHVIYPCLSCESYNKIITKTLDEFALKLKTNHGFSISVSDELKQELYRNFVYPSQGVRPVFSGISSFLSEVVPPQMFHSFREHPKLKQRELHLTYEDGELFSIIDGVRYDFKYDFDLNNVKNKIDIDRKYMFAVHECGHALAYCLLYKIAPKNINIEVTSFDGAYVIPNKMLGNKEFSEKMIQVLWAGAVSESIFFGESYRSHGSESDIQKATDSASTMVRKSGLYGYNSMIGTLENVHDMFNGNVHETNSVVDKILEDQRSEVKTLLNENIIVLIRFIDYVIDKKQLSSHEIKSFLENDIEGLDYYDPMDDMSQDEIVYRYKSAYEEKKEHYILDKYPDKRINNNSSLITY